MDGRQAFDGSESNVSRETLGAFSGPGAAKSVVSLTDDPLPGGYEHGCAN